MNAFFNQLQKIKPAFLPGWLYWLLFAIALPLVLCALLAGLWVVFTQIDFM